MSRHVLVLCLALLGTSILAGCRTEQPNVVIILVDDLGWSDTGVYGSPYHQTPAIDALADEGVRFTQFYSASPVCSPTRASIMTGRDPARLRITNWIGGEQKGILLQAPYQRQLPLEETTIGEAFSDAGYRTGYIGKWHLGREGFKPENQGFDYTFAVNDAGQPGSYFPPYENPNWVVTNVPDLEARPGDPEPEELPLGGYLTNRLTDAALGFVEDSGDEPFLLVLSHYAVHTPLQAPQTVVSREAARIPTYTGDKWVSEHDRAFANQHQDNPTYAAMVRLVDESVGQVLVSLDESGLRENTIVVFVSDNGGLSTLPGQRANMATSNAPLRAGKGWLFEGGVRIPLIVSWPRGLGSERVVDRPGSTNDLLPTLLDLAGLAAPEAVLDGVSLRPAMEGSSVGERPLFWHFPHYHGSANRPGAAVRAGDLKLIQWFEGDPPELYDLGNDPGELIDLAASRPAVRDSLLGLLSTWRESVGAAMPEPNPDWPDQE